MCESFEIVCSLGKLQNKRLWCFHLTWNCHLYSQPSAFFLFSIPEHSSIPPYQNVTIVTEINICHGNEKFTITIKTVLEFHLLRNSKFDWYKGVPCLFPDSLSSRDETWIDIQKRVKVTWVLSSCLYTFLYLYTNTIFRLTPDNSIFLN